MEEHIIIGSKAPLHAALLKAQMEISPIKKDARNTHGKYDYAKAEAVITASREVLHKHGLHLTKDSVIEDKILKQVFHLHLGFECESYDFHFPIVERKGMPFDKACSASLTTSMAYFLRDLLLIPRKDADEIDRRDDSKYEPKQRMISTGWEPPL